MSEQVETTLRSIAYLCWSKVALAIRVVVMGYDGSDFQAVATDSDGHLQVDVLSGGGGTSPTTAVYASGKLDAGSVGAGYSQVVTPGGDARGFIFLNTLNQEVMVSLDGGATDHFELDVRESGVTIDLHALGLKQTDAVHVKHTGSAPTTGRIRVVALR